MNNLQKNGPNAAPDITDKVEVPAGTLVRCPKVAFNLAPLEACVNCASFVGVTAPRFPGGNLPFHQQRAMLCAAEPVKRELFYLPATPQAEAPEGV